PSVVVERHVWGADVDPLAAAVAAGALRLWALGEGSPAGSTHVVVGDTLAGGSAVWADDLGRDDGVDVVVGDPPFPGQLGRETARTAAENESLRMELGDVTTGYVDTAALFFVRAIDLVRAGGSVALVLPQSFLVARDAGPARNRIVDTAELVALWW